MSTPTTRGKYKLLALGEGLNTWGISGLNQGVFERQDEALHGYREITLTGTTYALTATNYVENDIRFRQLKFTGNFAATITIPSTQNWWFIENATGQTLTFSNGTNTATLGNAFYGLLTTNGTTLDMLTLPDGVNVATIAPEVTNGNIASIAAQIANSNIPNLAASAVIASMNALSPQAVRDDMALLAVQDVIDDMALLAVQAIIDDMALLAVQTVIDDMAALSPQSVRDDMALLAVNTVINNMATIASGSVITDMAAIVAGSVRADMAAINSGTVISDLAVLSPASVRADMAAINSGTVISDMAAIIAGSVRADMAAINSGSVISDMAALNTGTVLADITGVNGISSEIQALNNATYKSQIQTVATAPLPTEIAAVANIDSAVSTVANNLTSIGDFGKVYQVSTNNPTARGDNSTPILSGDLAYISSVGKLRVYNGSSWEDAGSATNGTVDRHSYVATANQTTFPATGAISYNPNFVDVYLNGIKLVNGTDVTVTSGTNIVLATGAAVNDTVDVVAYGTFALADMYTKAQSDNRYVQPTGAVANISGGAAQGILYQSAASTTAHLAAGTTGQFLQTNGSGSAPTWVNAPAGSSIASTLKFA